MAIPHTTPHNSRGAAARCVLSGLLAVGVFAAGVFTARPAEAQRRGNQPPNAPSSGPGRIGAGRGGVSAPPGRGGGSPYGPMPGMPGMQGTMPGAKQPTKRAAPERTGKPTEPVDLEKLPSKYHVPQEPPEALTTTEEWIEEWFPDRGPENEKDKNKRKAQVLISKYRTILGAGEFADAEQRKFVADMVRWKLSLLTRKEFREQAQAKRYDLWKDITQNPTNKSGSREVRKFVLQTIADEAPRLFKYHAVARINGAILLADLSDPQCNEAEGDGRNKPAESCLRALQPLKDLVDDKNQLVAARIWGVIGLVRIASLSQAKPATRNEIVELLVKLVNESAGEHEWYQWRLVEGLGRLNVVMNADKKVIVP